MKVVYVDYEYHYGQKDLGLNDIAQDGFINSFRSLGHNVVPFFYDHLVSDTQRLNTELEKFCNKEKPDMVFFIMALDVFDTVVLSKLKEKYITVNFFGDDHWRFNSFTRKFAHCFSYCVTTDPFALDKYNDIGYSSVILSQWAALNTTQSKDDSDNEYLYDVSFVGGANPYRKWFVRVLESKGINVSCFGVGWPNGTVSCSEMQSIFEKTKINLNISNSRSYDLRFLFSQPLDFLRQLVRSTKSSSQIKARNFEIPAFNGFQMTEYVPFLERYLDIGREVVCFSNVDEAADLIKYYLKNANERVDITYRSNLRASNEHCYLNRLSDILDEISMIENKSLTE